MEQLEGVVAVEVTGRGSKGERPSVVLHRDGADPPLVLRTRHPASLSAEPELAEYAGRRVRVRGHLGWASFVVAEIEEVTEREVTGPAGPDGP